MSSAFGLFIAAITIFVVFPVVIYNRLVALRQVRKNAFADIDVQLKQRYDLIPNLVETVKGYAGHEKSLMENVTESRSRAMNAGANIKDRAAAESALSASLMNLLAVTENYPDLKANANFMNLQRDLNDLENKIAASRRFFNNATGEYNTAVQSFPANIIAGLCKFSNEDFLEFGDAERAAIAQAPKVAFG